MRIKQDYMEFSFASNTVSFGATAKKIVVDWGDSTTGEYININYNNVILHAYPNSAIRTVKIQEERLISLWCEGNSLTSVDVNACAELTLLDVSACTKLTELRCNLNKLTSLNISSCTKLTELSCGGNQLTSLDVSA
jgi:hypothetical protein